MRGQWITQYTGTNTGTVVIDLDEFQDRFEGTAIAWDDNPELPNSLVRIRTPTKAAAQHLEGVPVQAIDNLGNFLSLDVIQKLRDTKGLLTPNTVNIDLALNDDGLSATWISSIGSSGRGIAVAPKTRGGLPSELHPIAIRTWDGFKKHVNALERRRYIYRGQENSEWRIRTSFHRTGRSNLERYLIHDIPDLHKALSALTPHPFNLNDSQQYGAFINLAQHHGYPTPMLDWTWSPYVAAFFAFHNVAMNAKRGKKVSILKLDIVEWNKLNHADKFFPIWPNVSVLNALAFGNPRAVPQQSISTITNVDDIESHIQLIESKTGKTYLDALELSARDREYVMQELALMGITAGSLFPGLDGACESLKEQNF
jgi:hypothetical protein